MQHSALLNVMIAAARKAARAIKRDFGELEKLQVSLKSPANFVTAADRRAEETIYAELMKARPGYGFLGEESGRREGTDKSHTWIVDPLDGTTNFLHGIPHFAISMALERDGAVVAGLIYNPATDEMFIAEKGKGAFLNDQRIRVAGANATCGGDRRVRNCPPRTWRRRPVAKGNQRGAGARGWGETLWRRRARSRLDRGWTARRLLGADAEAVGHGGGTGPRARGRWFRHRL